MSRRRARVGSKNARTTKKNKSAKAPMLREIVKGLRPVVEALQALEVRAAGVEFQYDKSDTRIDPGALDHLLEPLQQAVDRDWRAVVGTPPEDFATADDIRRVLAAVEALGRICGVDMNAGPLPHKFMAWTADVFSDNLFYEEPRSARGLSSRFYPSGKIRLGPDGSLLTKR